MVSFNRSYTHQFISKIMYFPLLCVPSSCIHPSRLDLHNLQSQRIILHINTSRQNRTLIIRRIRWQAKHDLILALDEILRVEGELVRDVVAADRGADCA